MKNIELKDVFTPSQPAAEVNFIQRPTISRRFDRALDQKGKQVIIYGPSGAGKTSLIRHKIHEGNIRYLITHCVSSMTFQDVLDQAFSDLNIFNENERVSSESNELKAEGKISIPFIPIKAGLSGSDNINKQEKLKRVSEFLPNAQNLVEALGDRGMIWIVEDFHKIIESEKKHLAQVMKLFMDKSTTYPNTKIIAIGAVNTARQVVKYDQEMRNRVSEIEVNLMEYQELESIIIRGERLLNIQIADTVKDKIVKLSSGLPSVTHQLCYLLCEEVKVTKAQDKANKLSIYYPSLDKAIDEYVLEYSDTFKSTLEQALKVSRTRKHDNPSEIFRAILSIKKENFTTNDVLKKIQIFHRDYKGRSLEKHLKELTTHEKGEILRYLEDSELFYFSNPFIKAYFQCSFSNDPAFKKLNAKIKMKDFKTNLENLYQEIADYEDDMFDNPFEEDF